LVVDKLFVAIIAAASLISIAVVAAFASEVLQSSSSSSPLLSSPAMQQNDKERVGFFASTNNNDNNNSSLIVDQKGDARPDQQYKTSIVPAVMGYHDILWADVRKTANGDDDGTFLLTAGLAGDPNLNEKYETTYVWHIMTSFNHVYTVILPNFAPDSGFAAKGWYFAVYNNTGQKYTVPMTRISFDMPRDRVEFPLEASLVGSPQSFHYWVSVHVRVDSQNLDKPPDYLMDYAP
jgi:hypothetical protein